MQNISSLLPEIRLSAPGAPNPVALLALTRSLTAFLDRSEAWREWGPSRTVAQINTASGFFTVPNYLDDPSAEWTRIKRIDMLQWDNTGDFIKFATPQQLHSCDRQWRTRTGSQPTYFTPEGEGEGVSVRLFPQIASSVPTTYTITPRVIITTIPVAGIDLSAADNLMPQIPDRIFFAFREGIVAGALANLCAMPGKDWTDMSAASFYAAQAAATTDLAKSRSDAEYGPAIFTVAYGGIP